MPQAVWLLKVACEAVPLELEGAVLIDGASRPGIVLPLAWSSIASAFILAMVMN